MKYFILTLCIVFFSPSVVVAQPSAARSSNQFTVDLYKKIKEEKPKENIFFSPFSIYTALGMTYGGATDQTAKEFAKLLYASEKSDTFHSNLQNLSNALQSNNKDILSIANALWIKPNYPIEQSYQDFAQKHYGAAVEDTLERNTINKWVESKTNNKIKDLIKPGMITADTIAVLTNAIYFLGQWQSEFDKSNTKDQPFYGFDQQGTVPLMFQNLKTTYAETDDYQFVSLPYQDTDLAMGILLPTGKTEDDIKTLENNLNADFFDNLFQSTHKNIDLDLYMPKFKLETELKLKETLKQLGLTDAFSDKRARFCMMVDCNNEVIYIDNVVHKAFIDVDEEGTEAAAATAVLVATEVARIAVTKKFRADRPFLYFIYDTRTNTMLFLGRFFKT